MGFRRSQAGGFWHAMITDVVAFVSLRICPRQNLRRVRRGYGTLPAVTAWQSEDETTGRYLLALLARPQRGAGGGIAASAATSPLARHNDTSPAFDKTRSGRIAVKVINHLGDEAMKVFRVA